MRRIFFTRNASTKPARRLRGSLLLLLNLSLLLNGCRSPQFASPEATISVTVDGATQTSTIPAGSTVQQALQIAGIAFGNLDRADPPVYTVLNDGDSVVIIRVREIFETEEQVIPFDKQIVRNESLPEGETRLVQAGANGSQEVTYRRVLEDGVEISKSIVKSVILVEAIPEIVMIGAQTSFAPLPIPGKLAYIAGGNAWVIDTSTANRFPLVTTGDLDGRIFRISPRGDYLIYTRKSTKPAGKEINVLWAVRTNPGSKPFQIGRAHV